MITMKGYIICVKERGGDKRKEKKKSGGATVSVLISMHSLPLNYTNVMLCVQFNGLLLSLHVRDSKMMKLT